VTNHMSLDLTHYSPCSITMYMFSASSISNVFEATYLSCCACCTGENFFETPTEADSNDIIEHPHDDKPRPYVCTVCNKRFTRKGNLKEHTERHVEPRPYVCTVCDKRFAHKGSLKEHIERHSGEKPRRHVCTVCNKLFTNIITLI